MKLDETMKRQSIAFIVISLVCVALAAPLGLSGTVKTNLQNTANLRVGAFLTDRSGNPSREVASVAVSSNAFSLSIPDAAPTGATLNTVVADNLDWPGLVGKVTVTGQARIVRVVLRAYTDTDRSGSSGAGDNNLETVVTRGRGSLVLLYSDARFRVQGDKGFDATLEQGWNLVAIELGKSIEVKRVNSLDGVQLEAFGKY
ncbi:MAG: hypothetical protein HC933_16685 [Pleurocapsa sp. SU_196_0]|nr:hypothetical protein [Pleurocapsa sp. SU_196_0]